MEHYNNVEAVRECNDSNKTISGSELLMTTNGRYRHTYTATASDITPLYRLTPNAMLMYFQDSSTRLDLDFNFHVSNRSYVCIALLTMPENVLSSQMLSSLIVHWLHETYLDDTLTCRMSRTDDGSYLHTLTNTEGVVVCELLSRWQSLTETADVSVVLNRKL